MTPIDRPRVLLVDDNETILKRVTATLAHVYEIVAAVKDGGAALDASPSAAARRRRSRHLHALA